MSQKKPAKGFYILPNLFTTAGLFAGFYAIMQARLGHFEAACLAIYGAMLMDIVDGRLARLTNTQSDFGSEYDSLADMVSFGVAPAMVMYEFALVTMERYALLPAFIYVACAALRLARFNVAKVSDKKFFIGIPSPAAAAMVASLIWVCIDYTLSAEGFEVIFATVLVLLALAMVSNIKYRSFKDFEFKGKMPFLGLIVVVLVMALIYLDPPMFFLVIGIIYFVSGAITYFIRLTRGRSMKSVVMDTVAELSVDTDKAFGSKGPTDENETNK
ncbi:MAG: CDP-diacylglycerol--serine O-phosphatidyltransferase [Gammaproteobacteria bacterium]|nr:CDP-diacylglycerol--serine O-phosphatidyltransferase [Gammaproteobacteria bacterium]